MQPWMDQQIVAIQLSLTRSATRGHRWRQLRQGVLFLSTSLIRNSNVTRTSTAIAAILSIFGSSVGPAQTRVDTSGLAEADLVHITGNNTAGTAGDTRDISSREQIDSLYRVVSSSPKDWHRAGFDSPLLKWKVEFIREGKVLGSYGVGSNFLAMNGYLSSLQQEQQRAVSALLTNISM